MSDQIEDFLAIDLDAERKQRAAAREGKKQNLPIIIGGQTIAVLPVELPIDVLEPLRTLDADLTMILRSAMQAARGKDAESRWESTELVVDVLAANPALPVTVLDTVAQVAKNLLTADGFTALMASRPTREDFAALTKGVFRFYGVTLGEALEPSGSSTASGVTSSTTSESTSASTPAISTPTPAPDVSSESVAS